MGMMILGESGLLVAFRALPAAERAQQNESGRILQAEVGKGSTSFPSWVGAFWPCCAALLPQKKCTPTSFSPLGAHVFGPCARPGHQHMERRGPGKKVSCGPPQCRTPHSKPPRAHVSPAFGPHRALPGRPPGTWLVRPGQLLSVVAHTLCRRRLLLPHSPFAPCEGTKPKISRVCWCSYGQARGPLWWCSAWLPSPTRRTLAAQARAAVPQAMRRDTRDALSSSFPSLLHTQARFPLPPTTQLPFSTTPPPQAKMTNPLFSQHTALSEEVFARFMALPMGEAYQAEYICKWSFFLVALSSGRTRCKLPRGPLSPPTHPHHSPPPAPAPPHTLQGSAAPARTCAARPAPCSRSPTTRMSCK